MRQYTTPTLDIVPMFYVAKYFRFLFKWIDYYFEHKQEAILRYNTKKAAT